MPRIDLSTIAASNMTGYPPVFADIVSGRWVSRIATVAGLNDFGVSHVVLHPGAASAHRHWHEDEDEFVVMLSGHATLVEEGERTVMGPGDMAAFPKGEPNGHHLCNESDADCIFLAIGRPPAGDCHYSDVDLRWSGGRYTTKDGKAF